MSQIYLSLIFHNHQPVGNFDFIFKDAFEKAYKPLTDCLDRHPTIQVAMHFTGPLLDWLKAYQPQYLEQVAQQVQRGQLEILSGAYYEPVVAMLPDDDKLGQIRKLTQSVEQLFGKTPTGMWLAERIWEPYFPKPLHQAAMSYTILDDTHFIAAGFSPDDLFGYFSTEEQGHSLKLIPTQKKLRYMIPWRPIPEVMQWLREQADSRNLPGKSPAWAVMGDDGEKFGLWPHTYTSVWGERWLDKFFDEIEKNADWLHTIQPGTYVQQFKALGRAYLPTASYMEMEEWALPATAFWSLHVLREQYELQVEHIPDWDRNKNEELEKVLRFLRGGFWRNFLVKYPEINHMQKRGQALSHRIHQLPENETKKAALDAVWASQCNCAYWHGVFGGVYLVHIRSVNYANIIRAEIMLESTPQISIEKSDFNADTYEEILASNGPLLMVIEPAQGGMVTELDYRPALYNLLNIMTRYPEGYHAQIIEAAATNMLMTPDDDPRRFEGEPVRAKEKGLEKHIYQDWHRRGMFVDHFVGEQTTLKGFEATQYPEQGDFVNQQYQIEILDEGEKATFKLWRDGHVWVDNVHSPLRIEKTLTFEKGSSQVKAHYRLTNQGTVSLQTRFGVETALGFDGGDNREYCYLALQGQEFGLNETREHRNLGHYTVCTRLRHFCTHITLSQPATLWHFPLAPITLSEGGFERVHQGMVLFQWWSLRLGAGESWEFDLDLSLEPMQEPSGD